MKKHLFYLILSCLPILGFGQILQEGFNDITTLEGAGWTMTNQSSPLGTTGWFQGGAGTTFPGHQGGQTSYIGANFNNTAGGTGTISNWLITPTLNLKDGDKLSFYSRTADGSIWNDRLEVRSSVGTMTLPSGAAGVGSFTNLHITINPDLNLSYPEVWTQYEVTVSGVGDTPVAMNFAFRYHVPNAGPTGTDSNFIGIDTLLVEEGGGGPVEYCEVTYTNNIEPITHVIFAGIDYESDPTLNGSPAMEDFTAISGDVTAGESYEIALEGNTDGSFTNTFTVFVDWNQDGDFTDAGEMYLAGSIFQSTGTDGIQAISTIDVPSDALSGSTRMRIIKDWTFTATPVWPTDPCGTYDFGQTEDYTLNVTEGGGPGGDELLIVDLTVENQVTITATTNVSAGTVEGSTTTGFYFENFFANAGVQAIGTPIAVGTPTLTAASVPTDNSPAPFRASNTDPGLNIWSYSATTPTTFTTGEQAFTGDATWTISPELYAAMLTAPESGNVYFPADDVADLATATLLGTYIVILPGGGGEGCEWTVTVSDTGWGDEVSWELRDSGGAVVLSGGPYPDSSGGYSDTQTITAEGPIEFFIESIGTFNDNSPAYSISNENGEIITGTVTGGTETTITAGCDDLPPPPPAFTCDEQEVLSNGLENGLFFGGDTDQLLAVDVIVGDEGFMVYGSFVNVFIDGNTDLDFSVNFYANDAGVPGTLVHSSPAFYTENEFLGNAFGFDVYRYKVGFEDPFSADANTTYWMEIVSNGLAWEATSASFFGSGLVFNNTNTGGAWTLDSATELVYELICNPLGVSDMNSFDFTYYPNPVRDILNIDSKKSVENVSVFNLAGQKVMADAKVSNGQINVNSLTPGTYVFRVTLEGGQVETFKIIKK